MAAELMLINPRRKHHRRRRKARVTHARRNPRKRRRRAMSARQAEFFGKRRRRGSRRARVIRARRNPRRRHRRHYTVMRRNPSVSSNPVGFVSNTIVPAAVGAVGGVAVNYIFDNYAPTSLQTGVLNPVSRLALAGLLGMAAATVTDNRTGAMVAAGAMTVTVYDMITNFMNGQGVFASSSSSQSQYGNQGGQQQMGRFVNRGMGRVGRFVPRGLGYMSPARAMRAW
jgi:hypothetical protein